MWLSLITMHIISYFVFPFFRFKYSQSMIHLAPKTRLNAAIRSRILALELTNAFLWVSLYRSLIVICFVIACIIPMAHWIVKYLRIVLIFDQATNIVVWPNPAPPSKFSTWQALGLFLTSIYLVFCQQNERFRWLGWLVCMRTQNRYYWKTKMAPSFTPFGR